MTTLIYAGIGARATPGAVLADMMEMAAWLSRTGWHLASGGADGADSAFAGGAPADRRTLYLPWPGYNGHKGPDCRVLTPAELSACMDIAARLHPALHRCSPAVRKLHARNAAVVLSANLDRPVDAVIAWTPDGAVIGGTGMALRMAAERRIPVMNLAAMTPRAACERLLATVNHLTSGGRVANLSVATDESYLNKQTGERVDKTEWHRNLTFQDGLISMFEKHARKGRLVYIDGKLQTRRWSKPGGDGDRFSTEILLVPGGRVQFLDKAKAKYADIILVHGGGPGVERIAAQWAERNGVHQVVCKPDWNAHGRADPFRRNDELLNLLPKGVIAFPGSGIIDNRSTRP